MLIETKGIVLKAIRFRESSFIITIFTEKLGLGKYIVSGIGKGSLKRKPSAVFFQVGAQLSLVVYHDNKKNIHRIK